MRKTLLYSICTMFDYCPNAAWQLPDLLSWTIQWLGLRYSYMGGLTHFATRREVSRPDNSASSWGKNTGNSMESKLIYDIIVNAATLYCNTWEFYCRLQMFTFLKYKHTRMSADIHICTALVYYGMSEYKLQSCKYLNKCEIDRCYVSET